MTGSSVRPRSTRPSPWFQRSAEGGTASRIAGNRPSRVVNAIRPSSRASRAPRQWWMPWPKARWLLSLRVMSKDSGVPVAVRVAVGGGQRDDHLGVGGDDDVAERDVLGGVAERRVRDGGVPAQHLLDRPRQQAGVGDQRGALIGMAEQGDRPVADQAGGGVVPGDDELEDRGQHLLLVQRVAFVACPDQVGDQVLARLDAFAVEQLGEVAHDVRRGRDRARAAVRVPRRAPAAW